MWRKLSLATIAAIALSFSGCVSTATKINSQISDITMPKTEPLETDTEVVDPPPPTYDIDSPESYTVVVNKRRAINPINYVPGDLVFSNVPNINQQPVRQAVATALELMRGDAIAATGAGFLLCSGYRSYELQQQVYSDGVYANGQVWADSYIARPGYSEHQLGLAIDIGGEDGGCVFNEQYAQTPSGIWVQQNAHKYGFILRYPAGAEAITGISYEAWHWRFVGVDTATKIYEGGFATLEEFFGLDPAPDYG